MLRKLRLQLLQQGLPALSGQIHFIDKEEGGHPVALEQVPQGQGVGLDAVGAVDDQNRAVQHRHGPLRLRSEVHMARRIHQGDVQIYGLHQRQLGEDGNAPAPLQRMGIQKGVPVIHPPQLPPGAGHIEQRL